MNKLITVEILKAHLKVIKILFVPRVLIYMITPFDSEHCLQIRTLETWRICFAYKYLLNVISHNARASFFDVLISDTIASKRRVKLRSWEYAKQLDSKRVCRIFHKIRSGNHKISPWKVVGSSVSSITRYNIARNTAFIEILKLPFDYPDHLLYFKFYHKVGIPFQTCSSKIIY